ncbi:hypothetical protein NDU88_008442 [Pleurodeles waltl]|uniref:Uncharacterized protein n=1 Tax=Pleurodeles waltl TaxID=8319 RepID=A0AAV7QUP1_PLEWA|nr:hypothetical protein NDU88_008442 [Pleurodeles waltl]
MSPTRPQLCARLSAQAPFRAAPPFKVSGVFCFLGARPLLFLRARERPRTTHFTSRGLVSGPRGLTGRESRPFPRAPVASPSPATALWGLAPLGPSGHRRTSLLSGGPGAAQRHSFLLPVATPGLRRRSLRENLLGPPCRLWPSAHARERLTASREALAPSAGTGRQPLLRSTAGSVLSRTSRLEWEPGCFQDRPPVPHLHLGTGLPGDGTPFLWICIGPSGARGLSVRHLRIVGHAPSRDSSL